MDNENNMHDRIVDIAIDKEMKQSFISYAMSVITARALPDVRDGLKPVHRRILFAMNEMGLEPNKPHKKCARITGDTMGKYHPHGDLALYSTLVRMAQDFSLRYPLVDGHGNFGSIDGYDAAAQRYTEARLSKLSTEMLTDIEKNTVDFTPNYDGEFMEPTVLPSRFPNLLVNGTLGIAVGMASNILPHNLTETVNAVIRMIDNYIGTDETAGRETEISELIDIVKGPDFPTGATILGTNGIKQAFLTGRGKVLVRSEVEMEEMPNGKTRVVVTQLPYQVNKRKLIEKIAELVKDKKVDGITYLNDDSDRHGIRIVMELRRDANANVVLNNLYKHSQLQESFGINMMALVDGEPKILNLKDMLEEYLKHQKIVVTRRTQFDLDKALKRAHIVEGFLKALDHIDEIIAIIRSHREVSGESGSKAVIMERFGFTQEQADAIVEMRLRALSGLERERLEKELAELNRLIAEYREILGSEKRLLEVIRDEITVIRDKFGDERRTKIVPYEGEIEIADLIDEETNVITLTHLNYIKRLTLDTYTTQNRGGRGVVGVTTRDEDIVKDIFVASTHDDILFLTNLGKMYRKKAFQIPEAGRTAKGTAVINLLNLSAGEKVASVIPVREYDGYLLLVTKKGIVKKTNMNHFKNIRENGLIALNIREEDELLAVLRTNGEDEIFIATKNGIGIRFSETKVREVGRTATGVKGVKLSEGDIVIGAVILPKDNENKIIFVAENGYGKCTEPNEFRLQGRSGKGLKAYKVTEKTGGLIGIALVSDKDELMLVNSEGVIIRIRIADISTSGRATMGVKLINLHEGVKVISLAKIAEENKTEAEDEGETEEV